MKLVVIGELSPISTAQNARLWVIAKKRGWADDELRELIKEFNYQSTIDISRKDYQEIVNQIETRENISEVFNTEEDYIEY